MSPDDLEKQWQARARSVRRRNFWRAAAAWIGWSLVALVLLALAVVLYIASSIDVVI